MKNRIATGNVSPILLPDYRFEKALTKVQHIRKDTEGDDGK